MLRFCVLATVLVLVTAAPVQNDNGDIDLPHIRVKRTGDYPEQEDHADEAREKKSHVGYMPDDVKEAEGDESAKVQTELLPAEDASTEAEKMANPSGKQVEDVVLPPELQDEEGANSEDPKEEEILEKILDNKTPEDLTDSEEQNLKKLMSDDSTEVTDEVNNEPKMDSETKSIGGPSQRHKGRYFSDYYYDLYGPFSYGRKRRAAAKAPAVTAEDMMGGAVPPPTGRRKKRDLKMDELRTLLEGEGDNELLDYDAPMYDDSIDYSSYDPDLEEEIKEEIMENELANVLAEELAEKEEQEGYGGDYGDYGDYGNALDYPEPYEEYYDPGEAYDVDQEYPEDDLTLREKMALMGYLENNRYENEDRYPSVPYDEYLPVRDFEYPEVEETYEDLGPVKRTYNRQYLSFVPGIKRSGQFYPSADGWWEGLIEEQKRNDMEYERLLRLADALRGPEEYYVDKKR